MITVPIYGNDLQFLNENLSIFVISFYVHLQKMIMLEKACPWDKNSHFRFPDIKMHTLKKKCTIWV